MFQATQAHMARVADDGWASNGPVLRRLGLRQSWQGIYSKQIGVHFVWKETGQTIQERSKFFTREQNYH